MRWPRWRRDEQGHARADRALVSTERKLAETRRRDEAGERLADRIRVMRAHNHLAEAIAHALREGR
jgi:hypothetical protein